MKIATKNLRVLTWTITTILIIAGLSILWNRLTIPPRLPLQNLNPGQALNLELIKQLGGGVSSGQTKPLIMKENLVYIGMGPRLAVIDISNPSNITLVGQSELIPDNIGEAVMVANYVYIAPGVYGDEDGNAQKLHIVDVSRPKEPEYVASYAPQEQRVSSVYAFDNYLYVTTKNIKSDPYSYDGNLYILNISNPTEPKEIGRYKFDAGIADIAASGNYIYVATNTPGLRVLDISNLRHPKEIKKLYSSGAGDKLAISGNYLYLSGSTKNITWSFHVLDISNPREPREVSLREQKAVQLASVYQNIAYFWSMGDQESITFVDINNPQRPRDITTQKFVGRVISIQENLAFVMDTNRLRLFDVSDPIQPTELGSYAALVPDNIQAELYFDGTKGLIPVNNDIYFLDFSNPSSPVLKNVYHNDDLNSVMKLYGDFVYIDTYLPSYYEALDISDPIKPAIIWRHESWDENNQPFVLVVEGKYAYLINPIDGFYTYEISDPASPKFINLQKDLKGFDGFDDYAVSGNYLYILNGRDIHILDITDPTAIVETGVFRFPPDQSGYMRITIIDDLAFLDNSMYSGSDPAKLTILDVSEVSQPKLITSFYWSDYSSIDGFDKQAVFINDYSGLHILDFSNPKAPKEIGYYGLKQDAHGPDSMALGQNNFVYVASYPDGLYVFRYLLSK